MPKPSSDKLFRLIKALSPTERRYFRLFAAKEMTNDSAYIRLFDLMVEADVFEDSVLQSLLYPDISAQAKKYTELKRYLYEQILKALARFDYEGSIEARLHQRIQSARVLFRRGHYAESLDLLSLAKDLAAEYEHWTVLLDVLRWEKKVAYAQIDVETLIHKLQDWKEEEVRILGLIEETSAYRLAFFSMLAIIKQEAIARSPEGLAKIEAIMALDIFSSPNRPRTHSCAVLYWRTVNLSYYLTVQHAQFYASAHAVIGVIESKPTFLKENLSDYIAGLSNLILACGLLKKYEEVEESLQKLWNLRPLTKDDSQKIYRQYFSNKFALCIFSGKFEEGRAEMRRQQEIWEKTESEREQESASFLFQYFYICFGCGLYDESLDWLNHWLSQPKNSDREDLRSLARILLLIVHFEMGNYLLCESLFRSAARFSQKRARFYRLEKLFISTLGEMVRCLASPEKEKDIKKILQDARKKITSIAAEPAIQTLLQTFDFEAWIESKLSARTLGEVLREKSTSTKA